MKKTGLIFAAAIAIGVMVGATNNVEASNLTPKMEKEALLYNSPSWVTEEVNVEPNFTGSVIVKPDGLNKLAWSNNIDGSKSDVVYEAGEILTIYTHTYEKNGSALHGIVGTEQDHMGLQFINESDTNLSDKTMFDPMGLL